MAACSFSFNMLMLLVCGLPAFRLVASFLGIFEVELDVFRF